MRPTTPWSRTARAPSSARVRLVHGTPPLSRSCVEMSRVDLKISWVDLKGYQCRFAGAASKTPASNSRFQESRGHQSGNQTAQSWFPGAAAGTRICGLLDTKETSCEPHVPNPDSFHRLPSPFCCSKLAGLLPATAIHVPWAHHPGQAQLGASAAKKQAEVQHGDTDTEAEQIGAGLVEPKQDSQKTMLQHGEWSGCFKLLVKLTLKPVQS